MSDLVEFLLARIAEDEAFYRNAARVDDPAWQHYLLNECQDGNEGYIVSQALRMLKECEAKRRIVTDRGFLDIHGILSIFGARILGYMAEPYRDHPDYDEAWRP